MSKRHRAIPISFFIVSLGCAGKMPPATDSSHNAKQANLPQTVAKNECYELKEPPLAPPSAGINWLSPKDKHQAGIAALQGFIAEEDWLAVEHYRQEFGLTKKEMINAGLEVVMRRLQAFVLAVDSGQRSPKELQQIFLECCKAIHRLVDHFPPDPTLRDVAEHCPVTPPPPSKLDHGPGSALEL